MNLGNDLYFKHPFVSNSDLSRYLPAKRYTPDLIEAYALGTLLDAMLTCPETVDFIRLRVIGYDYQFTAAQFKICVSMRNAARKNKFVWDLLKMCSGQQEFYTRGIILEHQGFRFQLDGRSKYDLWSFLLGWGADIKTTAATTLAGFLKACDLYDYDRQRAWYMRTSGASRDVLIGISKVEPHPIFIHTINAGDPFHLRGLLKMNALCYEYEKERRLIC